LCVCCVFSHPSLAPSLPPSLPLSLPMCFITNGLILRRSRGQKGGGGQKVDSVNLAHMPAGCLRVTHTQAHTHTHTHTHEQTRTNRSLTHTRVRAQNAQTTQNADRRKPAQIASIPSPELTRLSDARHKQQQQQQQQQQQH